MLTRASLEKNEASRTEPPSAPQQVPLLLTWDHEPKISADPPTLVVQDQSIEQRSSQMKVSKAPRLIVALKTKINV